MIAAATAFEATALPRTFRFREGPPREAIADAMARFAPLTRAERQARISLWTMYYFAALIIPAVTAGVRTGRVPTTGIDALVCTADADGHVVDFQPICENAGPRDAGDGFEALVRDHLAIAIADCAEGLPAGVAWSNAAVMIDHALSEARLKGPRDAVALGAAEALIDGDQYPLLARPYRPGQPRVRRVCCLRDRLPHGEPCADICPRTRN